MIYKVMVQWYTPEQGGRRQRPIAGRYFATTYLNESTLHEEGQRSMWSITLKLGQSLSDDAELEFLFDCYPRVIQVGDVLPILEGNKTIALMLIVEIRPKDQK